MCNRWLILLLALGIAGCGSDGGGIVGAPGGRDGIQLRYQSPRTQVVPADRARVVTLSIEVLSELPVGGVEPLSGALLKATREEGRGEISVALKTTNSRGIASFDVSMPATGDKTKIKIALEDDAQSFLPFDVVAAAVVPADLQVGSIWDVALPTDGALVRLAGVAGAEYIAMPYQTDTERSGATYRLLYQGTEPGANGAIGVAERPAPRAISPGPAAPDHVVQGSGLESGLKLSDEIPNEVNIRSCRIDVDRMAPLRYLGERIAIYVDGPRDQDQARIDSLGIAFDESIFPLNTTLYGPTTDLDDNQRVLVVMSPELEGAGGVYCDTIRTQGLESFYGNWNTSDPIDRPLSTLAHEHQHVINAGYHLVTTGAAGDDRWLNEGLSYSAEALHQYWGGVMVRVWQFLSGQNGGLSMLPLEYSTVFNDRYMMFLLYLRDRFGPNLYQLLGASGKRGVANIESVTGVAFETLLHDWFVATAISNQGLNESARYNYRTIDIQNMADEVRDCQCIPLGGFNGMAMEHLSLSNAFDVSRTLDRADADYYRLIVDAGVDDRDYDLYFDGFGRATTRLTIIRAR